MKSLGDREVWLIVGSQDLYGADEIGAERIRIELASLDAFVRVHYPRLVRLAGASQLSTTVPTGRGPNRCLPPT